MANPYLGEIRIFAGPFAPIGWKFCDGALLSTADYGPLFELVGTRYGGDGISNFALPDMRGRAPMHMSSEYALGSSGGEEWTTLTTKQIPEHRHTLVAAAGAATSTHPQGNVPASWPDNPYGPPSGTPVALAPTSVEAFGQSLPHSNMPPVFALSFIIAVRSDKVPSA